MLINLAAAGVSPRFPGRRGDVQVLFHAELGKNAFILWHVADTNGAARLSGQGVRSCGGAPMSCQVIRPLATGRWPAMQLTGWFFPCPRVPVRQCTLPGVVQDRHSTANAGCRKSDLLPVNSTWTFSPYPASGRQKDAAKLLPEKERSEKSAKRRYHRASSAPGLHFSVPDAKGWCKKQQKSSGFKRIVIKNSSIKFFRHAVDRKRRQAPGGGGLGLRTVIHYSCG